MKFEKYTALNVYEPMVRGFWVSRLPFCAFVWNPQTVSLVHFHPVDIFNSYPVFLNALDSLTYSYVLRQYNFIYPNGIRDFSPFVDPWSMYSSMQAESSTSDHITLENIQAGTFESN